MRIQSEPTESNWAALREAQLHATRVLPPVGMAVITEVGEETDSLKYRDTQARHRHEYYPYFQWARARLLHSKREASIFTRRDLLQDAIGRLGMAEYGVIAPATGAEGAARMSERLLAALDAALSGAPGDVATSAGYETFANLAAEQADPDTLISRAVAAFHTRPNGARVRRWES